MGGTVPVIVTLGPSTCGDFMHYYKRNIGDYAKKAGRLSMLEHGAYTLLIDACYDRERFPTEQEAIEWAWARSEPEIEAVRFVLNRFFVLTDGVYVQERIRDEVEAYKRNAENNARIAREREQNRTKRTRTVDDACSSVNEAPPNQEPLTKNQEPGTIVEKPRASRSAPPPKPDDVSDQVWSDWCALRKAKRANVSATVLSEARVEAGKAGVSLERFLTIWCARGSQGLEASWLKPHERGKPSVSIDDVNEEARRLLGFSSQGVIDA